MQTLFKQLGLSSLGVTAQQTVPQSLFSHIDQRKCGKESSPSIRLSPFIQPSVEMRPTIKD